MAKTMIRDRALPPVDFELVDVDPRPIDLKKAREAYPKV